MKQGMADTQETTERREGRRTGTMAEQTDEKTAFVIPSEPFPQIVVSGLGTPLDAELSRAAGMRLWQERLGAIGMMLERSGATLFTFDLEEDTFYFLRVEQDGQQTERKIRNFSAILDMAVHGSDPEGVRFAEAVREAIRRPMDGVVEFYGSVFSEELHWNRLTYKSVPASDGIVSSIIGYSFATDGASEWCAHGMAGGRQGGSSLEAIASGAKLEAEINRQIHQLPQGDKGTLFLIELTNLEEHITAHPEINVAGYAHALSDMILSDFRGSDLLGQVREDRFVLFICGHTPLDIIERRAQRVIELVHKVSMKGFEHINVSIGVAATGAPKLRYQVLLTQAEAALKNAKAHGKNNYRVFFEEEKL